MSKTRCVYTPPPHTLTCLTPLPHTHLPHIPPPSHTHLPHTLPPSHTHLPPKLDIEVVLLPEDPFVRLHVKCGDRRMVADLLSNGTVPTLLTHQFVRLTQ